MQVETIRMTQEQAAVLFKQYREHNDISDKVAWEVQRAYHLLAKGKLIIKAIESVANAGLNRDFLPKLALAPALASKCYLRRNIDGSAIMGTTRDFWRSLKKQIHFKEGTFRFPAESFPLTWDQKRHANRDDHEAQTPMIPSHLKPKRGIKNYHILWEAEWSRVVPRDPYLLRRIGEADLWLVVGMWELTEVERAALSTRV